MDKFKTVLITVGLLWLLAFASSKLISGNTEALGSGIAIIPIEGAITLGGGGSIFSDGGSSNVVLSNLMKANKNAGIKAIVLEVNSPGGTVVASKEIADAVKESEKPVVAWIREIGASGAYWIASDSDWIVADELSITGSVGVISSYLDFSGLLDNYNVSYERLVAGELKDTANPYREMTSRERGLIQGKLNLIQREFINNVVENRKLTDAQKNEISTGFFYLGIEAMELGLIDEFGGREEAINKAKELGNLENGKVVEYKKKTNLMDLFNNLQNKAFYSMGRGIGDSVTETNNGIFL